jgi:hypothetical protein
MMHRPHSIIVVSALALLCSACGQGAAERVVEGAIERETGGAADVDLQDESLTITTEEGTLQAGGDITLPSGWPSDLTVYPGAKILTFTSNTPTEGEQGIALSLLSTDSEAKVFDYYAAALPAAGWTVTSTMRTPGRNFLTATKGTRECSIMVGGGEGQTSIILAVQD